MNVAQKRLKNASEPVPSFSERVKKQEDKIRSIVREELQKEKN